ncbi:MAG: NYN domain-containing protein [bacterium]|nr:NYN domain-containing protein [bacterium]
MPAALKWLIDGYNLLFQSNWVGKGRGPDWLERARQRMLVDLARHIPSQELASVRVVFDAGGKPRLAEATESELTLESGLRVSFASDHAEADDLMEELIQSHPHPKSLTVVSSDHRLRRKAKARRAQTLTSDQFLDALSDSSQDFFQRIDPPESSEVVDDPKSGLLSDEEVGYWLRQFHRPG